MERLSSNPESGMAGASAGSLDHLGKVVSNVSVHIDLAGMFSKNNYLAYLVQEYCRNVDAFTGIEIACDHATPYGGEFAATVKHNGGETATLLSFVGMFQDIFGKPNLLLVTTIGDDEVQIYPDVREGDKLYFLICNIDLREIAKEEEDSNVMLPYMAVVDETNWANIHVQAGDVAYTLLRHAYLSTLR